MPDFSAQSKFNASKNYTEVKFGADAPLLEVELNELQQIQNNARAELVRQTIHSGFTSLATIGYLTTANQIKLNEESVAFVNGYQIKIPAGTVITLPAPPTFGTRDDLVFLEAWFEEIDSTKDTAIKDSRIGQETSRRIKLNWRIRTVADVNFSTYDEGVNDANKVKAWGGTGADTTYTFTKDSADVGLYKAGNGSQDSKNALKTADGYVYAIPLFRVKRRNNAGYREDNLNGARDYVKKSLARDLTQGTYNTITLSDVSGLQVGDYFQTNIPNLSTNKFKILEINTTAKTITFEPSLSFVGVWVVQSSNIQLSDRPDGKYANIIDKDDIIDLRHQVSLTGFNYQKLLEENFDKLLRGELQTKDKPVMKKERFNLVPAPQGLKQELVPVCVMGNDGVTRELVNLLGASGNCENLSNWLYNSSPTLDNSKSFIGNNSVKITSTDRYIYKDISNLDPNKYYLFMAVAISDNDKFSINIWDYGTWNNRNYVNFDAVGNWTTKYIKFTGKSSVRISFGVHAGNSPMSANLDAIRLFEIDQYTYDKIDVDPEFTGDKLAQKFPYVDSYPNFVENLVKPVFDEDFWNSAPIVSGISWGERNKYDPIEKALKIESWISSHHGHSFYLPIIRDVEFTLSAKMKNVTNAIGNSFYLALFDNNNKVVAVNYTPEIIANYGWKGVKYSDYTDVSITFKIPSGVYPTATKYTIQFTGYGQSKNEIYLRDIQLEARNTKSPYVPYGRWFLPHDYTSGQVPTNFTRFNDHRGVVSDAQTSVTRTDIVEALKTPQSHIKVTQATEGQWSARDTIQITSQEGVITGVLDGDTALARVVQDATNTTTVYVDDVSKLSVNDTVSLLDLSWTPSGTVTVTDIDKTNKTVTFNNPVTLLAGAYLVETTASTSVPTVTATGITGTWSGLGTKQATFTITTPPTNNTDPIKISYSISYPAGQGISEVPMEVYEASVNGQRLVKASDNIVRVKANFEWKVDNGTDLVPHIARGTHDETTTPTSLVPNPTTSVNQFDFWHSKIQRLDGVFVPTTTIRNGGIPQQVFSFDLIRLMEDKFSEGFFADCVTTADKVNKLKSVITKITCNWWGYGSSPTGNKATMKIWISGSNNWSSSSATNTESSPSKLSFVATDMDNNIDSNGFCHFLAYADPSDGTTASTIYTNYVELEVEINVAETGYDVLVPENPFPKLNENLLLSNQALPVDTVYTRDWSLYSTTLSIESINGENVLAVIADGTDVSSFTELYFPAKTNTYYTVSAEIYVPSSTGLSPQDHRGVGISVYPYNTTNSFGSLVKTNATKTDSWQKLTLVVNTDSRDALRIRLYNGFNDPSKKVYFRKIKVQEGIVANPMWTPGRKKKTVFNFLGKVAGSTLENRNKLYNKFDTTFGAPSTFANEQAQTAYNNIGKQDGVLNTLTTNGTGQYAQELYEFDLSALGLSLSELKKALRKLTFTWVGYGKGDKSGVQYYGVIAKVWFASNSGWSTLGKNDTNNPSPISYTISTNLPNFVTNDQKLYILVHTMYPAGTASASELYTDYIKLEVELADYVDYVKSNVVKVRKETKEVKLQYPAKSYRSGILDVVELFYKTVPQYLRIEANTDVTILSELDGFLVSDLGSAVGHKQGTHHWKNPLYRVSNDRMDTFGDFGFAHVPFAADSKGVNIGAKVTINGQGFNANYTKQYGLSVIKKPLVAIGAWLVFHDGELKLFIASYYSNNGVIETGNNGVGLLIPIEGRPLAKIAEGVVRGSVTPTAWRTPTGEIMGYLNENGEIIVTYQ